MQLHAVLVPPPDVVQDAVDAAREMLTPAASVTSRRGILDRFRGRQQVDAPTVTLVPARPEAVFVRLAAFGNVAAEDATALGRAIEAQARTWPAPVVHVSALRVAEASPFDVTGQLDGDVDVCRDIFLAVNEVARTQRFFLDRRIFHTELGLGSLGVQDGDAVPDAIAGAEAPHEGPLWSPSHVTLLRTSYVTGGSTFAEVMQIPLAARPPS